MTKCDTKYLVLTLWNKSGPLWLHDDGGAGEDDDACVDDGDDDEDSETIS